MRNNETQFGLAEKAIAVGVVGACIGWAALSGSAGKHKAEAVSPRPPKTETTSPPTNTKPSQIPAYHGLNTEQLRLVNSLHLSQKKINFIKWTMPLIVEKEKEGAPIQAPVVEAQAILESKFGENAPGNEYFGVKATKGQPSATYGTTEKQNGSYKPTKAEFAQYANFEESLEGYIDDIITLGWYHDAAISPTWEGYLYGLQHDRKYFNKDGQPLIYATAGEDYTKAIINEINEYHLVELSS
jgi:flagellum-specific peptidoglycan hydrolase FlgJ